jgi:hypothetical protein
MTGHVVPIENAAHDAPRRRQSMARRVANSTHECAAALIGVPRLLCAIAQDGVVVRRWFRTVGLALVLHAAAAATAAAGPADAPVPPLLVPAGVTPFLRTHAVGTQNYVCVETGSGLAWRFVGPQATLFVRVAGFGQQLTTHFLSPNPDEAGVARATWQGSFDSSRVWARASQIVDDPAIVGAGNIPWLLLERVGSRRGPTGGRLLSQATHIQRIHTVGGVAPSTGCSQSTDAGALALVPYSTDYVFFR